jgi:hypothetical protein
MNPLTQSKNATILPVLIALTLGCFGLVPQARAVCQEDCLTNQNTVLGEDALFSLTTGSDNVAVGFHALFSDTTGSQNIAVGSQALASNTSGLSNIAVGASALGNNTGGFFNVAVGFNALNNNTGGKLNVAVGNESLESSVGTEKNVAIGHLAMSFATSSNNTAVGYAALQAVRGKGNAAVGNEALRNLGSGLTNVGIGSDAGGNLFDGDNNIYISNLGMSSESGVTRIGTEGTQTTTFIAGIRNSPVAGAVPVGVTADGQLGVRTSSRRFKTAIKPMDNASGAIFSLKPVTFRYKKDLDPDEMPQFGLVAEDVAKVSSDLVTWDAEGKPFTIRYDAVNAMLLK